MADSSAPFRRFPTLLCANILPWLPPDWGPDSYGMVYDESLGGERSDRPARWIGPDNGPLHGPRRASLVNDHRLKSVACN